MVRPADAKTPSLAFMATMASVAAAACLIAALTPLREAATIILFIPLIWAYLTLSLRAMIVVAVLLAAARVAVEALQVFGGGPHEAVGRVLLESAFPIALYAVLGVPIYFYRVRQARLTRELLDVRTAEVRAQMARSLAHDFGNILTIITGTSQLLSQNASLDEQAAKDVQAILDAGRQGVSLIGQVRSFARAPQGGKEPRELSELTEQQMLLIERVLPMNIRTVRAYAAESLPIIIDVGQFLRLLMNLCLNARDAMPEGGTLTVRTEKRIVDGRPMGALIVSDTGVGIAPLNISRLFEPFFTTRAQQGGMGLGLSIVKMVVDSHGGQIGVDSLPGKGSTFTVLLPLAG